MQTLLNVLIESCCRVQAPAARGGGGQDIEQNIIIMIKDLKVIMIKDLKGYYDKS